MRVIVKLYATLTQYREGVKAGKPIEFELPDGATVQDLIRELKIPHEQTRVTFVNGIIQEAEWGLKEGDEVGIFPPIGGG